MASRDPQLCMCSALCISVRRNFIMTVQPYVFRRGCTVIRRVSCCTVLLLKSGSLKLCACIVGAGVACTHCVYRRVSTALCTVFGLCQFDPVNLFCHMHTHTHARAHTHTHRSNHRFTCTVQSSKRLLRRELVKRKITISIVLRGGGGHFSPAPVFFLSFFSQPRMCAFG
jgi:hypothetical protein